MLLALQTSHIFFSACLVYLKSMANRGSIIHPKKNSFTTFFSFPPRVFGAYVFACVSWCTVCTTFFPFPPRVFGAYVCACVCWCTVRTSSLPFGSSSSSSFLVTRFRLPESPHFLELNHPFQFKTFKYAGNDV